MVKGFRNALQSYLRTIYQTIDITTAVLLLTGQITIRSIIFTTGGEARITVAGPIFGIERTEARPEVPGAAAVIDGLDVILALLIILGEMQVSGLFISQQRFALQISGPPLGSPRYEAYVPQTREFFDAYRQQLMKRFGGD